MRAKAPGGIGAAPTPPAQGGGGRAGRDRMHTRAVDRPWRRGRMQRSAESPRMRGSGAHSGLGQRLRPCRPVSAGLAEGRADPNVHGRGAGGPSYAARSGCGAGAAIGPNRRRACFGISATNLEAATAGRHKRQVTSSTQSRACHRSGCGTGRRGGAAGAPRGRRAGRMRRMAPQLRLEPRAPAGRAAPQSLRRNAACEYLAALRRLAPRLFGHVIPFVIPPPGSGRRGRCMARQGAESAS